MGLMGDIVKFPPKTMRLKRLLCDCGCVLEYWLGDDDLAYAICTSCSGNWSHEIEYSDELLEE